MQPRRISLTALILGLFVLSQSTGLLARGLQAQDKVVPATADSGAGPSANSPADNPPADPPQAPTAATPGPDALYYKGITISPAGSFIEMATVNRTAASGSAINTPPTSIPLTAAGAAQTSEFYASGRQSRIALKAIGKLDNVEMTAYYEMDWLGAGVTSNNNQSNSYVVRERQLWARAAFTSGFSISGGQMWSLTTETT